MSKLYVKMQFVFLKFKIKFIKKYDKLMTLLVMLKISYNKVIYYVYKKD